MEQSNLDKIQNVRTYIVPIFFGYTYVLADAHSSLILGRKSDPSAKEGLQVTIKYRPNKENQVEEILYYKAINVCIEGGKVMLDLINSKNVTQIYTIDLQKIQSISICDSWILATDYYKIAKSYTAKFEDRLPVIIT